MNPTIRKSMKFVYPNHWNGDQSDLMELIPGPPQSLSSQVYTKDGSFLVISLSILFIINTFSYWFF